MSNLQDFFGLILPEIWGHTKFGEKFILKLGDEFREHFYWLEKSFPNSPNLGTELSANLGLNMPLKLLEYLGTNSPPNLETILGIRQIWGRICPQI